MKYSIMNYINDLDQNILGNEKMNVKLIEKKFIEREIKGKR